MNSILHWSDNLPAIFEIDYAEAVFEKARKRTIQCIKIYKQAYLQVRSSFKILEIQIF